MIRWSWPTMGSVASLAVPGTRTPIERADLGDAVRLARLWLERVEMVLSPYLPNSDLCRWRAGTVPLPEFSPLLGEVVDACADLTSLTGGGFQPVDRAGRYDPSGYVKGWAVERTMHVLVNAGVSDACLGVGGDIQIWGTSDGGRPWRTAISDPDDGRRIAAVLEQPAGGSPFAVATSGAAQRGAHIWAGNGPVDLRPAAGAPPPRTLGVVRNGRPAAATGLASVTVVGPDLGRVDGFATAIWARALHEPLAEAWWWLTGTGCEALAIDNDGQAHLTPGMRPFLHDPGIQVRARVPAPH